MKVNCANINPISKWLFEESYDCFDKDEPIFENTWTDRKYYNIIPRQNMIKNTHNLDSYLLDFNWIIVYRVSAWVKNIDSKHVEIYPNLSRVI